MSDEDGVNLFQSQRREVCAILDAQAADGAQPAQARLAAARAAAVAKIGSRARWQVAVAIKARLSALCWSIATPGRMAFSLSLIACCWILWWSQPLAPSGEPAFELAHSAAELSAPGVGAPERALHESLGGWLIEDMNDDGTPHAKWWRDLTDLELVAELEFYQWLSELEEISIEPMAQNPV